MSNIAVLIPAYMPDQRFPAFAAELQTRSFSILVVNDGSGAGYQDIFNQIMAFGISVVHHEINLGKGEAIKTGIRAIMQWSPSVTGIITADCDGQHSPDDIERMAVLMDKHPDTLILGRRSFGKGTPVRSLFGNTITSLLYTMVTGIRIYDTQSGLRGLPACIFEKLLALHGSRYEYEMNMLLRLSSLRVDWIEMPMKTIYLDDNRASHYKVMRDSIRIAKQFVGTVASGFVSFAADYLLFFLQNTIAGFPAALAYITSRIVSSLLNYQMNSKLVFKSGGRAAFAKYYLLVISVMIVGSVGTHLLSARLGVAAIICKLLVDIPLFILNFILQKFVVFKNNYKCSSAAHANTRPSGEM